MRILFIGINFFPELTSTGKYSGELAAYLAGRGHAVRVITAPPYYPHWRVGNGYSSWKYAKEVWQGVHVQRCPLWVPHQPTGITRLIHLASFAVSSVPALLSNIFWKPDVVICVAPALMNAPFALLFARLVKARALLHIQDFELDAALKLGILPGGKWLASWAAGIEKSLLAGFDQISTISGAMLQRLHAKGISPQKTLLFPNWVDTNKIHPLPDRINPFREDLGFSEDMVLVLYAGNMGKKQGLEDLLIVARRLQNQPKIRFVLCGDGFARPALEKEAAGLKNVQFLPVQPFEKLNHLLNMADIHILLQKAGAADLVMPSKLSGMLASGRAVIATADPHTELGRIVEQLGALVQPENMDALEARILALSNSPAERQAMGQKGRAFVLENWDTQVVLRNFERHLDALIGV